MDTRQWWATKAAGPRQGATQWVRDRDINRHAEKVGIYLVGYVGKRKVGEEEKGKGQREGRRGRSMEKGERQKLPLWEIDRKEGAQAEG